MSVDTYFSESSFRRSFIFSDKWLYAGPRKLNASVCFGCGAAKYLLCI